MPSVALLFVTFNSENQICSNLDLLHKVNFKYEILIVDNNSSDKTLQVIKKSNLSVKLIQNTKNMGFAKGINLGVKIAKSEYLLFLNPDVQINVVNLEKFISTIDKKDINILGCKILNSDSVVQPSCGKFPTILNIIADRVPVINKLFKTELIRQNKYYNKEQEPDWISGAFFLVRRDVFLKLGGFDERYFMYGEDIDFCYRAKKAGYKILYNPSFEIIHYDMGKSKSRKRNKAINIRKGFTIFFRKYKSPFYCFIWESILKIESFFRPSLKNNP